MGRKNRSNGARYSEDDAEYVMGFEAVYLWIDPVVTGPIFGSVLVTLISFCYFSLVSVLAYTALFVLGTAVGIRLYVYVMNTFMKKDVADPLAKFASFDPTVSEEKISEVATNVHGKVNSTVLELRRLFLVENKVDSAKFGLGLWFLTYIGSWFNAMTLLILSWVGLFTIPKIYVNNQQTLDPILEKVKAQLDQVRDQVGGFLPKGARPATTEEVKKEE